MKKRKVLVLEGGYNEEHEISLASGREVKKSLSELNIEFQSLVVDPKNFKKQINNFDNSFICFNALHGTFGEDGSIQKILDISNFNYTHSNAISSYLGFNKDLTKEEIKKNKIIYPDHNIINIEDINEKNLNKVLIRRGQFIIKPNSSGSSFGIKVFKNENDIYNFISDLNRNIKVYKEHNKFLLEEFIDGRELTVAVVEKNKKSFPVQVTEIISYNNNFFDYNSKYTPGVSKHILPANIEKKLYDTCMNQAKIIHDKIGCRGLSRSDFILSNNVIYFLEINTQPGLTAVSLVPEQLKYQGISFNDLILNILDCSV